MIRFEECTSKGDFMNYCLQNDIRIKELDSAFPVEIGDTLRGLSIDPSSFCTCYWKTIGVEILNIVEHATKLYINK
jgi:hypothetical protein